MTCCHEYNFFCYVVSASHFTVHTLAGLPVERSPLHMAAGRNRTGYLCHPRQMSYTTIWLFIQISFHSIKSTATMQYEIDIICRVPSKNIPKLCMVTKLNNESLQLYPPGGMTHVITCPCKSNPVLLARCNPWLLRPTDYFKLNKLLIT